MLFEAVIHPTWIPTFVVDVCKVVEHLYMLWMGLWVHPYTLPPVQVGAKFRKFEGKAELK